MPFRRRVRFLLEHHSINAGEDPSLERRSGLRVPSTAGQSGSLPCLRARNLRSLPAGAGAPRDHLERLFGGVTRLLAKFGLGTVPARSKADK